MIDSTIEIAILIMLPLVIFYQRSIWKIRSYIFVILVLYLIWYLTYGLFHEFTHLLGVWIAGKEIFDYQLITHFWKGQLGTGYVRYDFLGDKRDFFIILLPYLRDLSLVIIGYLIIRSKYFTNILLSGLMLIILVLSSLYDITNNYFAYLMGNMNDFNALKVSSNNYISNLIGLIFMLTSLILTIKVLIISKDYPEKKETSNFIKD